MHPSFKSAALYQTFDLMPKARRLTSLLFLPLSYNMGSVKMKRNPLFLAVDTAE
jgi:hypothetical protein